MRHLKERVTRSGRERRTLTSLANTQPSAVSVTLCGIAFKEASHGALVHRLISGLGMRDAPSRPLAWMQTKDELVVLVGRDDQPMSDDLRQTLVQVLRIFVKEMRRVASGLARLRIG